MYFVKIILGVLVGLILAPLALLAVCFLLVVFGYAQFPT